MIGLMIMFAIDAYGHMARMSRHVDECGELTTFFYGYSVTCLNKVIMSNKNVLAHYKILWVVDERGVRNSRVRNLFSMIVKNALIHSRAKCQEKAP